MICRVAWRGWRGRGCDVVVRSTHTQTDLPPFSPQTRVPTPPTPRTQGRFYVNKYDLGYRRNLALFFGYDAWWHYLIPGMGNPPGDGITYPLCEDARRIGQRI